MARLRVSLVTPERAVTRAEVDMVVAPSVKGQVAVLPDHRPLLADLDAGPVLLKVGDKVDPYAISGGYLEVERNNVTILAETAERAEDIDVKRAEEALRDAESKLKGLATDDPSYREQLARVKRNRARVEVGGL